MKSFVCITPIALVTALFISACSDSSFTNDAPTQDVSDSAMIFNGKDLDGWDAVILGEGLTKEDVWSVGEDGVLISRGEPLGYLHTKRSFQDFTLTFEWRWAPGTEPTNSGVLLRIDGAPESFLPKCVEAQLKHQHEGDLYGFYGANISGDPERFSIIESDQIGTFKAVAKIKDLEKPAGEWNHYEIKLMGDTIAVKINGELVSQASGLDLIEGPVGFQSEGSEIHFRKIELVEAK